MNKFVSYLEAYVEWVAIGLAALWLIWVGYGYWLTPPVVVEFNGKQFPPGRIDKEVRDKADEIEGQLNKPELPPIKTNDGRIVDQFPDRLNMIGVPEKLLEGRLADGQNPVRPPTTSTSKEFVEGPPDISNTIDVANPSATTGKSLVLVAKQPPAEKIWVTLEFNFLPLELARAWDKAKLPARAQKTCFLNVELIREELINGQWTDQRVIPPLPTQKAGNAKVDARPSWPPVDTRPRKDYDVWASKHCEDIIEPDFFQVINWLASDPWYTASMPTPPKPFIPEPPKKPPVAPPPPTPHRLPPSRPPSGSGITRPPVQHRPPPPPPTEAPHPNGPGSEPGAAGAPPSGPQSGPPAPAPQLPADMGKPIPLSTHGMLPTDFFLPADLPNNLDIWAHDDTVVPEHTYRYKIILYMRNPLYDTHGIAKNPADEKIYELNAESDWTEMVTVPPRTYFFFTKNLGFRPQVLVTVYTWTLGNWQANRDITLEPGDTIPGTEYLLVDLQSDPIHAHSNQILIRESDGTLSVRTVEEDKNNDLHKTLDNLANAAKPAPGVPATPGGPVTPSGRVTPP